MTRKHANDDGAAAIFTYTLLVLLFGVLYLAVGFGVDKLTMVAANMYTGVGETELGTSTLNWMLVIFRAQPLIALLLIGINYWVSSLRTDSGIAETSTMIFAAVELVTISFVLMVFTFAGNYALSQVVGFVNTFPVQSPDLSLYAAVQYLHPAFLGIMVLILLGVTVQFAVTCTKTVDFSGYRGG